MPLNGVSVWNIPEPIVEIRLLEAREKVEERYSNSYEINVYMKEQFYSLCRFTQMDLKIQLNKKWA